jgi:predicted ATPase
MSSLVGRERELQAALSAYAGARSASSIATLLIAGPSGIGKSALLGAFAQSIGTQAFILRLRAYPRDREAPLALKNRISGELETLASAARALVLLVEDAHMADAQSLRYLSEMGRRFAGRHVVLAFTHTDENARDLPFAIDRRIVLGELTAAATRELTLAHYPTAPSDVVDAIAARSRGMPYEIVTIATAARRCGITDARRVDQSARAAIARNLASLSSDQRLLAQLLSLLPERVELDLVERLNSTQNVASAVEALDEYIVREDEYLCFRHELTASAVLETIAMRIPLHRRVIDALERGGLKRIEERQLHAEHALACGDQQLARSALLELAFAAACDELTQLVVWACERYIRLDEPPADRFVDFYVKYFGALSQRAQHERALSVASHALSEAQRRGVHGLGTLAGQLVLAQWAVDRRDAAKASYERYARAFADPNDLAKLREAAPWARVG